MNGFEHNICPGQSKNLHLRSFIVTPQCSYMNLQPWLLDFCSSHNELPLPIVHLRFRIIVWKETGFEEYTGTSLVGLRRLPQFCQIVDFQNALSTNNFFHKLNWMVPLYWRVSLFSRRHCFDILWENDNLNWSEGGSMVFRQAAPVLKLGCHYLPFSSALFSNLMK